MSPVRLALRFWLQQLVSSAASVTLYGWFAFALFKTQLSETFLSRDSQSRSHWVYFLVIISSLCHYLLYKNLSSCFLCAFQPDIYINKKCKRLSAINQEKSFVELKCFSPLKCAFKILLFWCVTQLPERFLSVITGTWTNMALCNNLSYVWNPFFFFTPNFLNRFPVIWCRDKGGSSRNHWEVMYSKTCLNLST